MSARANIAIADGEASPVTHTFTPDGDLSEGVARYINFDDSPVLSETLTISVRDSNSSGQESFSAQGRNASQNADLLR